VKLNKKTTQQPGKLTQQDDMIQQLEIRNGKAVNELPLLEGTYTVIVLSNKERTYREWTEYWFSLILEYCNETGNSKYDVHRWIKEHIGIESTKDIQDWDATIQKVKIWCMTHS
jgi:negative regulator of genetic competence, sporulation and motility